MILKRQVINHLIEIVEYYEDDKFFFYICTEINNGKKHICSKISTLFSKIFFIEITSDCIIFYFFEEYKKYTIYLFVQDSFMEKFGFKHKFFFKIKEGDMCLK